MSVLQNKIDFIALVQVNRANCNGDPLDGNRPRTDYSGFGEISDVCLKRKIRNRMQDLGNDIFVQSEERCQDGFGSLKERASATLKGIQDRNEYAAIACAKWLDVRTFGQVFAFKSNEKEGISVGVRGPVSIHQAVSVSPVTVESIQITKSVIGESTSDTMGMKHFVRFGLYEIKGSINVQLAEKTGFTEEDAETVKECLRTLFVNDASSARPDGSMEVVKLYWFKHNCKAGQYPSAKVHRSLHIVLKEGKGSPSCVEDYEITLEPLDGLSVEIVDGL
jgi:CRISPR-associated protein Csd2